MLTLSYVISSVLRPSSISLQQRTLAMVQRSLASVILAHANAQSPMYSAL